MLLLSMTLVAAVSATPLPPEAREALERWRAQQDAEMRGEESPLARESARELLPGHNVVGSGPTDGVPFDRPGVPAGALDLVVQGQAVSALPLLPVVLKNGEPAQAGPLGPGDRLTLGPLTLWLQPGPRGPMLAVSDASRSERLNYHGLRYLPVDGRYRVPARFEPAGPGRSLTLETSTGGQRTLPMRGLLRFELAGAPLSLDAFSLGERPNDYFVIFKDRTNGGPTYGSGRFLWVPGAVDGKTVIDFNLAWNPLCAYSHAFNCPLAPPENRLPVPIPVGEGSYPHD
ncbi:MAG: DUF1684 domain-containing protein [Deltaproteobacteria bacterium]